ncbi:flagellar basal body P-ring formation chaperone FlgA [Caenispirillum salinarum]|uniref:flagellar basal body P-ring formation chaperone FlgA n=1 Tax=Caenispirillum salinarum TaxID=859058 RepID=UPI00384F2564
MPRLMPRSPAKPCRALARGLALAGAALTLAAGAAQAAQEQPMNLSPQGLTEPRALEAARPAEFAGPLTLRPEATVDGAYVRLSDIFDNLPPRQDAVVAAAPRIGESVVYDADWLRRVAQQHALDWAPLGRFDQVIVVRDSDMVGRAQIIEALRPHLMERGMPDQADIKLNGTSDSIRIATAAGSKVAVDDLQYDPGRQRFTAALEVPAGSPTAQRLRVAGRVFLTTAVPVLRSTMRHGELIEPDDIDYVTLRVDQLKRDTLTDPGQLVGRTPRRFVQAGAPVTEIQVQRPRMVSKGDVVTMSYSTPFMTLTTQGRAMEHGGLGDQVRIQNLQSNTTVTAVVTDHNAVTVQHGRPAAGR